jgi:hypothetical protein
MFLSPWFIKGHMGDCTGYLVGRRRQGHKEFMAIVKSDRRYQLNKNYIFVTTVIAGDDLTRFR